MPGQIGHGHSSTHRDDRRLASPHPRRFIETYCRCQHVASLNDIAYALGVPKLWTDTIETHRREVRDAVLDTTARLIAEHGLLAVTMSAIAEDAGIGRATLYKYFPDVESILRVWHERQIATHLEQLVAARDRTRDPADCLHAVLETLALINYESHGPHDGELAAALHRHEHVHRAEHQLRHLIQGLLADSVASGTVRDDIPPAELAEFCLHALAASSGVASKAAARRLVAVTLCGLQPQT